MAKAETIQTRSFFRIGDRWVSPPEMTEAQRNYAGAKLKERYLNELFRGKADFTAPPLPPADQEGAVFVQLKTAPS